VGLQVVPRPSEDKVAAIEHALGLAGVRPVEVQPASLSAWRRAAAREAVENPPAPRFYAPSPRKTRGATRA